jgi:putative Flp pilus-assembly TadE/G-like protein
MRRARPIRLRSPNERGAVLVTFALVAPVIVLMAAFTIDAGNWFVHKRHLQVQADAAAFAAAKEFQPCANESIYARAGEYGGVSKVATPSGTTTSSAPLYNEQIAGAPQSAIHELINSQRYYDQSSPVDSTAVEASPCSASMVDVKVTETNLPWYWRLFSSVPYINAHARVEILQQTTAKGSLPVAVNDFAPKSVEAYFVDESVIPASQLMTCGASGKGPCGVALQSDGIVAGEGVWDNGGTPFAFAVNKPNVGVRVAVSGRSTLTGTMSTDCSQTFVECFDASSAKLGLLHIQGYSANGTGTASAPIARQAQLTGAPTGCSDGYFSNEASSCKLSLTATVNWGTTTKPSGADVDAMVNKTCYALTFQSSSGTNETWSSASTAPAESCKGLASKESAAGTGYIALPGGTGALQVNLRAKDSSATKTFEAVQRSYAASEAASGPIHKAFLGQFGGPARDADSFRLCETGNLGEACTPKLVVTVYLKGSLQDAQSISDPVYTMRFTGTGSQNQSVSCTAANGGSNYSDGLASGCAGTWAINPTLTCPGTTNPADCVVPATGNKENQVAKGMNDRILGSEMPSLCTSPNHWNEFTFTNGVPSVSPSDPRLVTVFITPFGSFGGSGSSSEFPIVQFASFYVTGWQAQGSGFSNPCQGHGDNTAEPGTIVGHFIKYIDTINNQTGESKCTVNSLGECVVVLTR